MLGKLWNYWCKRLLLSYIVEWIFCYVLFYLVPFHNLQFAIYLGQQEYSQRNAGIASGIVLAVLLPLVLLFVYIAYRVLRRKQKEREEEETENLNYEAQKRQAQQLAARKLTAAETFDDDAASSIVSGKETTID